MLTRRFYLLVVAIVLLAFIIRVGAVPRSGIIDFVRASECGTTLKNFVDGKAYSFDFFGMRRDMRLQSFMSPLYPFFIVLVLQNPANPAAWLGPIQAILSTFTVVTVALFAAKITSNPAVAVLSVLVIALYLVFVIMSAYVYRILLLFFIPGLILSLGMAFLLYLVFDLSPSHPCVRYA